MIKYLLLLTLVCAVKCSEQPTNLELKLTGEINYEQTNKHQQFSDMAFVENDSRLAIIESSKLTIVNVEDGRNKHSKLPYSSMSAAAINSKEKKIAARIWSEDQSCYNRSLQMIDMQTGVHTHVCDVVTTNLHGWYNTHWHSAGNMVVVGNEFEQKDCPHLIDIRSGGVVRVFANPGKDLGHCKFSPDGAYLAGATLWGNSIIIWNVASGEIERKIQTSSTTFDVYWSPDQKWLIASAFKGSELINIRDGSIHEEISQKCINDQHGTFINNSHFIFSQAVAENKNLELFNLHTREKKIMLQCQDNQSLCKMALSRNGRKLAVDLYDKLIKKFDTIKLFDVNDQV